MGEYLLFRVVQHRRCPQPNPIRVRKNHVISYDTRTKIPYWVYEKITRESLLGEADRKFSSFKADDSFKPEHRSELSDYRRSGFDKGHMAPAGNNKYNQESMDQTFILSSIAPQIGIGFNRHIWRDLEMWIRDELKSENIDNTAAHIITGLMFVPNGKNIVSYEVIGESHVAVPTHFYKIVLFVTDEQKKKPLCFVIPNLKHAKEAEFWSFQSTLESVESSTGLVFFPKLKKLQ